MLPVKCCFIWPNDFRRIFFFNLPTINKNCLWLLCLLTDRDKISNLYRGPSINASYEVSVHLDQRFQRRRFLENDQTETRIAYGGQFFVTDQDKMSNLSRGPSIDTSYQFSVHLAKQFQKRFIFRTQATRNKNVSVTYPSGSRSSSNVSVTYLSGSRSSSNMSVTHLSGSRSSSNVSANSFSALSLATSLIPCQIEQVYFL